MNIRQWMQLVESLWPARVTAEHLLHSAFGAHAADDIPVHVMKFSQYELRDLPVAKLHCDWQPRNPDNVIRYAKNMRRGTTPPPIIYDLVADKLIDGCHRIEAAKLARVPTLPAYVGTEAHLDPTWDDF